MRGFTHVVAAVLTALSIVPACANENYPNRPIKIIVVFSPGSSSDVSVRILAKHMSPDLGQPIVVENRPGAAGQIGMQAVQRSEPDGYTLVAVSSSTTVVAPAMTKTLPYDPLKDFEPIAMMNKAPVLMTAAKANPANNLAEMVAELKRKPGNYGNGAPVYQLAMELFKKRFDLDLTNVPYKGSTEALTDMIGGRIEVMADTLSSASGQIKSGLIKPIVMMSSERSTLLPEIPTMAELGYRDFAFNGWNGLMAPAGTPKAIIERLNAAIVKAGALPEVKSEMANAMLEPFTTSVEGFRDILVRDTAKYVEVMKETGIEKR